MSRIEKIIVAKTLYTFKIEGLPLSIAIFIFAVSRNGSENDHQDKIRYSQEPAVHVNR